MTRMSDRGLEVRPQPQGDQTPAQDPGGQGKHIPIAEHPEDRGRLSRSAVYLGGKPGIGCSGPARCQGEFAARPELSSVQKPLARTAGKMWWVTGQAVVREASPSSIFHQPGAWQLGDIRAWVVGNLLVSIPRGSAPSGAVAGISSVWGGCTDEEEVLPTLSSPPPPRYCNSWDTEPQIVHYRSPSRNELQQQPHYSVLAHWLRII